MVRGFLAVVIFVPFSETPVENGLYMRKIWDKQDNILLVRTVIALHATKKMLRSDCV